MANKLFILPKAQMDIEDIVSYMSYDLMNPEAAMTWIHSLEKMFEYISEFPLAYPKLTSPLKVKVDLRKCMVEKYLIIFAYDAKKLKIDIVRIVYSKSNYINIL
jgi:plasmid stabilization system protein ParE